ncbi:hypothetical protein [Bacillus cereus]|uniref:hypothetical protein n=1 Tax=Bacillus cereus TaxID=1396 RepID=UPI0015D4B868|nr:hypothetical protein [Bacillus cereus]
MNVQRKIEREMRIVEGIRDYYKRSDAPDAPSMVIAYEYCLHALREVYEVSNQEEVIPF